jgi:hypothetical protein
MINSDLGLRRVAAVQVNGSLQEVNEEKLVRFQDGTEAALRSNEVCEMDLESYLTAIQSDDLRFKYGQLDGENQPPVVQIEYKN